MLNKNQRLTSPLLKEVFKSGKSVFGPDVSLVFLKTKDTLPSKFSFSVSSKVVKTAVKRNAIRRKGYAVLEKNKNLLKPSFYVTFVVKKPILSDKKYDIDTMIVSLLNKAGIL